MGFEVALGSRIRKSPFFDATVAAGVTGFTIYNYMYMPTSYGDPVAEYRRLTEGVSMWDVSVQRQIQLEGPDAARLAQTVSCRDLSTCKVGQGRYAPMTDHMGRLLNDPVILRQADQTWWISIADADMLKWCRAIANERDLDVFVSEPDVSPLAVQGPHAQDVVASLLGGWVRDIKFFWYHEAQIDGIPLHVGRAGWSKQGGFELYLQDRSRGTDLWNLVAEAGEPWGIGPGTPNPIERIESGLLSYRGDHHDESTPFEVGLGRYVDLDSDVDFIGKAALVEHRAAGPRHELVGVVFDGEPVSPNEHPWTITVDGIDVGTARAASYSPRVGSNIAMSIVDIPHNVPATEVCVHAPDQTRNGRVTALPFV